MKVAPNKESGKIMLMFNGCHGNLMTSTQSAKNGKKYVKTYITL